MVEAIRVDRELDPVAHRHRRAGVEDDRERRAVVLGEQDVVVAAAASTASASAAERSRGASMPATTCVSVPRRSTTWTTAGMPGPSLRSCGRMPRMQRPSTGDGTEQVPKRPPSASTRFIAG